MRVALVTYALEVGGVETLLLGLARSVVGFGHQVAFVETAAKGQWSGWFEEEGFRVLRVLAKPWRSRAEHAWRVAMALREFDAVLLNDAPVAQAALGLLNHHQVAVVVLHTLLRTMVRNAGGNFSQVDVLAAVSPQVADGAARYGLPQERIILIPNGVSVPEEWPKRSRRPVDHEGTLRLVFVGSLSHVQKGVLHLTGIVDRVRAQGLQVHLDVVGDGSDRNALRDRIERLGLGTFFSMHGRLSNALARQVLAESDVLLMPSYFEGLPLVLLEAMALGVVPIASRLPGCTDFVVQEGASGMLVTVSDEEGFAARIVALCRDRSLLDRMSRAAWERTRGLFSLTRVAKSYLDVIQRYQEARRRTSLPRSGTLDSSLLGDLPALPVVLVRPVRKLLRLSHLMPPPVVEPLLF